MQTFEMLRVEFRRVGQSYMRPLVLTELQSRFPRSLNSSVYTEDHLVLMINSRSSAMRRDHSLPLLGLNLGLVQNILRRPANPECHIAGFPWPKHASSIDNSNRLDGIQYIELNEICAKLQISSLSAANPVNGTCEVLFNVGGVDEIHCDSYELRLGWIRPDVDRGAWCVNFRFF